MKAVADYFDSSSDLTSALVHRSYCNEHPGLASNERLEFLGDSVLSLIMSSRLYYLFPNIAEGELTSRRSILVQTNTLADKAKLLSLDSQLLLSKGEAELGGRQNPGLLANTFEAVLGSLYLKKGLQSCYDYLTDVFPDAEIMSYKETKDPKSLLQEHVQSEGNSTPTYQLLDSTGPDHAKTFVVAVFIGTTQLASGSGKSIQKAETEAAKAALAKLLT